MELYKYQGAGNDFIVADNRDGHINIDKDQIVRLCDRHYGIGADGLMLLESASDGYDFRMVYYNSDGSGGMMCGNGGRCIVAFAHHCGIRSYRFIAADGEHQAEILSDNGETLTVRLKMKDVNGIAVYDSADVSGYFLDTGTRHLVCPVASIDTYNVVGEGRRLRNRIEFMPIGTNVNFIEAAKGTLKVRTYEKGVEDETYACGTGITASAIAYWHAKHKSANYTDNVHIPIHALRDKLSVDFVPTPNGAKDVYLTGPATRVAKIITIE